jgi:hypothetical protein
MPGSFFVFDRHSGFYAQVRRRRVSLRGLHTFLASFLFLRCFAAPAFSILFRNRTGTRFDLGSVNAISKLCPYVG